MTRRFQLGPELDEIVDFSVEDDLEPSILVADRLRASLDVDNREADVAQTHFPIYEFPVSVRTTVAHDRAHAAQQRPVHWRSRAIEHSADSTHGN
jgi:hypothetical protein